jgi:ankyrin repeat protein
MAMIEFLLGYKVNPAEFQPMVFPNVPTQYSFKSLFTAQLSALDRAILQGDLEVVELLAKRQESPPDPENPALPWPFIINKTNLIPRLKFFSEIRLSAPEDVCNGILPDWHVPYGPFVPEPQSRLCAAIADNDVGAVERQILEGSDVNALDWAFETPLIKASRSANTEIVAQLLEAGAEVNFRCIDGTTALSIATKAGHTSLVSVLLRAGASITGASLTDAFCKYYNEGILDLIKTLLEAGVDPNFAPPGERAWPPICRLANIPDAEFVEAALPILLEAGVDVKAAIAPPGSSSRLRSWAQATPLHLAADHCNLFLIRKLLELGVDLDALDGEGRTPLHRALCSLTSPTMEAACSELIRYGAQLDTVGELRVSALHFASGAGNQAMVQELLTSHLNLNVDARDTNGRTPLMWSIMSDWAGSPVRSILGPTGARSFRGRRERTLDTDIRACLLDAGASVLALDNTQRSPLHWAAAMARADIMEILLRRDAMIDSMDNSGQTPLHIAIGTGAVECVRALLAAGANPNALDFSPASDGKSKQPLRRLELAVDCKPAQHVPMHLAIKEPDRSVLREMTKILLEAGANIFARNADGETTLHVAVRERNVSAVEQLICANNFGNSYLCIKDNAGKSARDHATDMGHERLIELLTLAEAGRTPFLRHRRTTVLL